MCFSVGLECGGIGVAQVSDVKVDRVCERWIAPEVAVPFTIAPGDSQVRTVLPLLIQYFLACLSVFFFKSGCLRQYCVYFGV